jgi:hypothetical protein
MHKAAVGAGAVFIWNRCAWSSSIQDREIQKGIEDNSDATVNSKPLEKKGGRVMDSLTDERLERMEKQLDHVETRLEAVEKTLRELIILLRKLGIERGKNYGAP